MNDGESMQAGEVHRLKRAAYCLVLGAGFAAAFSLPLGRALLGLSLLCCVSNLIRERKRPEMPPVGWMAAIFIVIAVVVTIHGVNPDLGVPKLDKLFWYVMIPVVFVQINTSQRARKILKAYALGAGVLALDVCVLRPFEAAALVREDARFEDFKSAMIHLGSMTDGQCLMLGVLIVTGLLTLSFRRKVKPSLGWWLLLVLLVGAQLVNYKRGSWFCTFGFVILLMSLRVQWKVVLIPIVVVAVFLCLPSVRSRLSTLSKEFEQPGGRMTMWTDIAPALIKAHPFGIGWRSLTNDMMRDINSRVEPRRDHLHSNIAQVLVATGWIGFAAYLAWMVRACIDGLRYVRREGREERDITEALVWLFLLLALLANGLVEYNFGDGEIVLAYGLIMGLCARGAHGFRPEQEAVPALSS
jgi:O-antigen ligase